MRVGFDGWVFDGERRQLLQEGEAVHVSPKAFDLLGALLARRPKAVSKPELKDILWPSTSVSDANLPSLVAELRRALNDSAEGPRFVRTVPRFGYAFCGAVGEVPAASIASGMCCRLIWSGREIALSEGENLLGRTAEAAVWVEAPSVSRQHARIVVSPAGATLEDLGSKNGTFIQRRRVRGPTPLTDGDQVFLGSALLVFRVLRPGSTQTAPNG